MKQKKIIRNLFVVSFLVIVVILSKPSAVFAGENDKNEYVDNIIDSQTSDEDISNPIPYKMADDEFFWHAGGKDAYADMLVFDSLKTQNAVKKPNQNNLIVDSIPEDVLSRMPLEEIYGTLHKNAHSSNYNRQNEKGMMSVTFVTNSAGDYGFFSGETWHQQDYSYYCGPASVANALEIINGTSSSQSTYATYMGTTSSNGTAVHMIVSALNNYQSTNNYGYRSIGTDYSKLWDPVITDTETYNVPCVVMLYTDCLGAYNGHRLNHFVLIRGFSNRNLSNSYKKLYYTDSYDDSASGNSTLGKKVDYLSDFMGGTTYLVW